MQASEFWGAAEYWRMLCGALSSLMALLSTVMPLATCDTDAAPAFQRTSEQKGMLMAELRERLSACPARDARPKPALAMVR